MKNKKKIGIGDKVLDFSGDVIMNTFHCVWDLAPCIFKYKFYRNLYLGTAALGLYPIIKLGIDPKHWILFTVPNFFIISGFFRTILQVQHRKVNRELKELFKKDVKVLNSIDIEKNINELKVIAKVAKNEFKSKKDQVIFKKLYFTVLAIKKHTTSDEEPIKKYMIRSPVPKATIIKKRAEISHLLDTNIISINQGKSKKIVIIKTCKGDIRGTDNRADEIQFLLNEMGFNVTSVTEYNNDSMDIYKIKTTSEFSKLNKKCNHIAFRLGIDKRKVYLKEDKGVIQLVVSGESKTYPFEKFIGLNEIRKMIKDMEVPIVIGFDLETGKLICVDMAKFPHALIMGGTGSGKSCFINVLIQSAMYFTSNLAFLMFDFKFVELNQYENFKNVHFVNNYPDAIEAIGVLNEEMNRRLKLFAKSGVKNLKAYNKKHAKLPYLVVVIDEAADIKLEANNKKVADELNTELNQIINKARATGIIIIYAMQRADSGQVSCAIRDQLMTKVGFKTSSESQKQFIELQNLTTLEKGEMKIRYEGSEKIIKGLFIDDTNINSNEVYKILKEEFSKGDLV